MPTSNERVPNRHLSGAEVREIIERDVHDILGKDGMFTSNIGFSRIAYEVRVSVHMDNPLYPTHVAEITSKVASIQQVEANPGLAAIEKPPLVGESSGEDAVFSVERHRQIASPNMARVEHDMPLLIDKRNPDTGVTEQVKQVFKGDKPDPESVGNITVDSEKVVDQRSKWNKPKKGQQ